MAPTSADDRPTLAALGILAFAPANITHEALGHGLTTLAVGGRPVLLTTCYLTSTGPDSKWIPAAGGLMNLAVGLAALLALRLLPRPAPRPRFFLLLVAAFNLFFAFGYPAYSGIARFGDWAAVTSGLNPRWLWRLLLIAISIAGYYATMLLLAPAIAPFAAQPSSATLPNEPRLLRLTLTPYLAAILLACAAGALNPQGWRTMLTSGLPAAAAAFGLTQLHHLVTANWRNAPHSVVAPVKRSYPCILVAAAVAVIFVTILGPGIRFHSPSPPKAPPRPQPVASLVVPATDTVLAIRGSS